MFTPPPSRKEPRFSGNLSVTQGDGNTDEVNFGVNSGTVVSDSLFSASTTIGGNLTVSQGVGTGDQVYFAENFGTVDSTSSVSFLATIGGNIKLIEG